VTGIGELLADPILLAQIIRELGRFSLVRIEGRAISVHRLIQALLRDELGPDEQARYRHDAHLILAAGAPQNPDDVRQWQRYHELVPHVTVPAMELDRCQDATVRAFALDTVRYLYASGDSASSKALAEKLVGQWTSDSGPDDPAILNAQRHLGNALRQLGEYPEAWKITQITLSQAQRILGEQDALTLALNNEFGADLRTRGDFAMALAHDLETRDRCEAAFGSDHPMTWHAMNSLVIDYGLTSDYRTARDLGQRVYLAQSESAAGASPIGILTSWTNLAWAIRLGGGFREARDVAEDARDYGRSELGPEHHATLRAALELSNALLRDASSRGEALELSGEVFKICTQRFGETHPATLAAAVSLSNAQRTVGLTDQALVLAERTVTRYSDVYGPDHPFRHGCAGNLALLGRVNGDPAEARRLNETALAGLDGRLGRDNCLSLIVATNLASDLALLGDFAGARELGEDTLARLRGLVGEDHPITLGCAANLTLDLRAYGAVNNADKLAADTMNRYSHTFGTDHPDAQAAAAGRRLDFDFDPPYI
jgi:tetratricopeptide (TPR) repeat protein